MTCTNIGGAIVCTSPTYRWNGWYFELHAYCGPALLKKNGDVRVNVPNSFWSDMNEFVRLPKDEQLKYRVSK